jgi:alpha/beta superfamily hydrolase
VARVQHSSGLLVAGTAFEDLDEAPRDIRAGVEWLRSRAHQRVAIAGHSLGAVKCIFTQATAPIPRLAALIAISPPRLAYQPQVDAPTGEKFLENLEAARALVRSGRGETPIPAEVPIPSLFGAAQFVKKYGPEDRYDLAKHFSTITVPSRLVLGTSEIESMVSIRATAQAADQIAAAHPALARHIVEGADHNYTGKTDALIEIVSDWLAGSD